MSFGLTNAPTTFMDLMNKVFQNYLDAFVIYSIDDILLYSKNKDYKSLMVVLQTLKEHQLYEKYSKCDFGLRSVTFIGHIISSEGVGVDARKMKTLKNWPRPLAPTNITSFLGLASYYRRFVDGFVSIASPLTNLTQKNKKF